MSFSFMYILLALAILFVIFLAVNRARGTRPALITTALTFVILLVLFYAVVRLITAAM